MIDPIPDRKTGLVSDHSPDDRASDSTNRLFISTPDDLSFATRYRKSPCSRFSKVALEMAAYSRARPVQEVSSAEEVDSILKDLQDACSKWHAMPRKQKVGLLQQVRGRAIKASVDIGRAFAKVHTLLML